MLSDPKYPGQTSRYLALGELSPSGAGRPSISKPLSGARALERQLADRADRSHAWQRRNFALHVVTKPRPHRRTVEVRLRQRHVQQQDVAGIDAGVDTRQPRDALDHEPCRDEHDNGERNLDADERRADDVRA